MNEIITKPYIVFFSIAVSAGMFSPFAWADNPLTPNETTLFLQGYQGSGPVAQVDAVLSLLKSEEKVDAVTQASRMTPGKELGCMCWGLLVGALGGGLLGGTIGGFSSGGRSFREVVDRSVPGLLFGAVSGGTLGMTYSVYWLNKFEKISPQESISPVFNFSWKF